MKRDGRKFAPNKLEEMRVLAVQRMNDGEHPGQGGLTRKLIVERLQKMTHRRKKSVTLVVDG